MDNIAPKRGPCFLLEVATHQFKCTEIEGAQLRGRIVIVLHQHNTVRLLLESHDRVGATRASRLTFISANVHEELIARDGAQPAAKRVARPILAKPLDATGHGSKHFLANIIGIGLRRTPAHAPMPHKRAVQMHEPPPGVRLVVAHSLKQRQRGATVRRRRRVRCNRHEQTSTPYGYVPTVFARYFPDD